MPTPTGKNNNPITTRPRPTRTTYVGVDTDPPDADEGATARATGSRRDGSSTAQ